MSPEPSPRTVGGLQESLLAAYGPQGWWPLRSRAGQRGFDERGYHPGRYHPGLRSGTPGERFEIAVGAVLTQNTTWRNAERALDALLLQGLVDPAAMLGCEQTRLAAHVRSCGYHNQKARKLLVLAAWFARAGSPRLCSEGRRRQLLSLWGIGPETADSILLYAFGAPVFVVDAYSLRLLIRLGWLRGRHSYAEVQRLFMANLPARPALFNEYHALIVRHAKDRCRAHPLCDGCPLARRCPWPKQERFPPPSGQSGGGQP